MSSKFLDKTGLDTLWAKIKSTFQTLGNLVTAWGSTPSDTKYPSEKLVKTSLDAKAPNAPSEVTIANGDKILIADSSDSSKVKRASVSFDGSSTKKFLTQKGTFGWVLYADETYGGEFRNSLSPFDNYAFKNSNCFFGAKASALSVEYSTDGGTTWTDYGLTDEQKQSLFSQYGTQWVACGKNTHIQPGYTGSISGTKDLSNDNIANQRLRITICTTSLATEGTTATTDNWIYCRLRRIGIYMSTNSGAPGAHCLIQRRTSANFKSATDTWVDVGDYKIQGDSGWNSIPCGNANSDNSITFGVSDAQTRQIRFTIWSDQLSSSPASSQTGNLMIFKIVGYSEQIWSNSSANVNVGNNGAPFTVNPSSGSTYFSKGITSGVAIPVGSGGTGKSSVTSGNYLVGNGTSALTEKTPKQVGNNVLPALDAGTENVLDTDYIIGSNHTSGATDTTAFVRRTADKLWNYIKDKISSVLGLTATDYGGNAATATTAAGYTSGGAIDTALQGKVDKETGKGLSTNDFTDAYKSNVESNTSARHTHSNKSVLDDISSTDVENWNAAEPNVQSDWDQTDSTADDYIKNKPTVSRYFNKYSGGTSVYGWKIGSTVTGNIEGVSSIITGVFTLALGISVENAPQESTAVKTMATMVGFFSCYARYESGANVVKARIYTPVSSIFNATYNLKYIDEGNGKFTWVLGFGTSTTPISKNYVHCSVNVMSSVNAYFGNFGDAITSSPTYADYFSVFKSPVIGQNTSGVGNATKPVYVDTNGFIKECTSVNADTVDGFHFSTSTSGSATNTVYLV